MIRNPSPWNISLLNSLLLTGALAVLLFFIEAPLINSLFYLLLFFVFSFITILITLEIFIYRKIKLIYKIIHDFKSKKTDRRKFLNIKATKDPISDVNEQVLSWVVNQNNELAELKKEEAFRKEFLGSVSHELKTPIFNIQGYLDTLLDGAIHDDSVNISFLRKAAKSADRLNLLVNELLAISQIETGKLQMKLEKFDIHQLTIEVFEGLEMRANSRNIVLKIKDGCDHAFYVMADKERIRQVLVNLIVNAINYGKNGGYVMVSFYDMDENILIEVSDNGEGITQEHLPRLFERFYRVDQSRSREFGGTGLGLAIVKHIIEAHEQTINVRSTENKGTTFGFTLKKGM